MKHRNLILGCSLAGILVLAGAFWGICHHDVNVNFLSRQGPAEWILKDRPRIMPVRDQVEESTTFRRDFWLEKVDPEAELSFRAFKHCGVLVNGSTVCDEAWELHWKDAIKLRIAKWLKPGPNQIEVTVFNNTGPPALWLVLQNASFSLPTDKSWESSVGGVIWKASRLADSSMPSSLLEQLEQGFLSPSRSFTKKLPLFLLFAAISLGIVLSWRAFNRFPLPHWFSRDPAALLAAVAVLFYLLLMVHNQGLLPDFYGFDADGHKDYISFIAEHHALPLASDGWEMFQAPLYYLLCSGLLSSWHLLISQHEGIVLIRFLGCAVTIAQLLLVMGCLRMLFPKKAGPQVIGFLLAAALPAQLYLTHYVSNEAMAALWMSAAILCCLKILRVPAFTPGIHALLGLFLGLALLSKSSAIVALPVITLTLLLKLGLSSTSRPRDWLVSLGLPSLLLLLTCSWHYWRVASHFGSPLIGNWSSISGNHWWQDEGYRTAGWYAAFGQVFRTPFLGSYGGFFNGLYATLFGDSLCGGQADLLHRPPWDYELMGGGYFLALAPTLLVMIGLLSQVARFFKRPSLEWFLLLGLASTFSFLLLYMTVVGPTWSSAKSFYALQALVPFCALGAVGWEEVVSRAGKLFTGGLAVLIGTWTLNSVATYWIDSKAPQTLLMRGVALEIAGQMPEAQTEFEHAVQKHPDSVKAHLFLGFSDSALGDNGSAEKNYRAALELHPDSGEIHTQLGRLLEASGRSGEALAHLHQAIDLEPKMPDPYNEVARILTVHSSESVGNPREALKMAQQGCELTRYQSPGALLVLADAYAGTGQSDLAARTASDAYRKRGDLLFMKEHREQAAEAYRESLRLNPANQDALRNLDLVMRRLKSTPTNPQ